MRVLPPPAPADKSTINGKSTWEPAASSRHLTSLIMNIHNKTQALDVLWPGIRTELLWAPPQLSCGNQVCCHSFNSPVFLFSILVRPIARVLHAKKKKREPASIMENTEFWYGICGYKGQKCWYMIMCRHCFLASCFTKLLSTIKAYREQDKTQPYFNAQEW